MASIKFEGGSWYYAINLGRDENGKRKVLKKRGFASEKEAKKAANEIENQMYKGTFAKPTKILYKDLLDMWLDEKFTIKKIKESTYNIYKWIIDQHIKPALGKKKAADVTNFHVEAFLIEMIKTKRLSDENIRKTYTIMNDSFNMGKRKKLIANNPCEIVEKPKIAKKKVDVWNLDEIKKFLNAAKDERSYCIFHLAIVSGMRQSEILGLQWDKVDLDNNIIYVDKQLKRRTREFTTVKTDSSNRNIAIDEETANVLRRQKAMIEEEKYLMGKDYNDGFNLVCPTSTGTPYLDSNLRKIFNRLITKSGVKKIRFHDLRHSSATLMLQTANPKIVSERLGHANVKTTLDIYTHVLPNTQKSTAEQFGDLLFGGTKE